MYRLTENQRNELDEQKYPKSVIDNQLCSLTCSPVFAFSDMYQNISLSHLKLEKKTKPNELSELEY